MSDTVLNFRTTVYTSAPWLQENDKQEIDEKLQIYKKYIIYKTGLSF